MGDLPQALPKTVIAADHVRRHADRPAIQNQATDLLQAAARAEIITITGGPSAVPAGVLGELVTLTSALAGRRWLKANAATPAVETFTTLSRAPQPPPLPTLDHVLSALLWSRFSGPGSAAGAGGQDKVNATSSRMPRFGTRRNRATA